MRIGIHSPIFLSLYPFGFHSTTEFKIHRSSRKSLQFTVQWVFLIVPFTDYHCTSLYISTDKQITSLNAPVQCTDKHFKQLYPAVLLIRKKSFLIFSIWYFPRNLSFTMTYAEFTYRKIQRDVQIYLICFI